MQGKQKSLESYEDLLMNRVEGFGAQNEGNIQVKNYIDATAIRNKDSFSSVTNMD